jgi:fructose-bisphosphate aldolase, class II
MSFASLFYTYIYNLIFRKNIMPLKPLHELYQKANKENYALGAFNINTVDMIPTILETAEEMRSPVIVASTTESINYIGIDYIMSLISTLSKKISIPFALHLDHGSSFEEAKFAIENGFTSVMIDRSHLSLEENIKFTKEVVDYAHPKNITVEAELGRIAGVEGNISLDAKKAILTDPDEAEEFIKKTGCDSLAIAVGTSHGAYKFKGESKLEYDRITEIKNRLGIPLVLHGASSVIPEMLEKCNKFGGDLQGAKGVSNEALTEAIKRGVNKVNIDTDIRLTWIATVREIFETNKAEFDPKNIFGPATKEIKRIIKNKMEILGSAGKA